LVGSVLRDIATALGWSGVLGESVGAWFGVRFAGAPNGGRADGDITDHRLPVAVAPPACRRAVCAGTATQPSRTMSRSSSTIADDTEPAYIAGFVSLMFVAGPGPCRLAGMQWSSARATGPGVGLLTDACRPQRGPPARGVLRAATVGPNTDACRPQTGPPSRARADDEPAQRGADPAHSPRCQQTTSHTTKAVALHTPAPAPGVVGVVAR
jgi:hypothetical protein